MNIPQVYMLHIDTSLCYCIPEIYNQLFDAFRIDHIRSLRRLTWSQYLASLDMGIEHDGRGYVGPDWGIRSDYYRVVDPKKFMMHAVRLGVVINDSTPTRVPLPGETYAH
jgi:hypothetical protein